MSDSELSEASRTPVPSDNEIEQSLRREVARAIKAGEEFSLRQIRTASEKKLSLPDGFYKGHETWKDKSKEVVQDQMENDPEVPSSPVQTKKAGGPLKKKKTVPKPSKRQSDEADGRAGKKQKTKTEESSEELSSPLSETDSAGDATKPKKTAKPRKSTDKESATAKMPTKSKPQGKDDIVVAGDNSDSDLSVLIDEEPNPKKKGKGRDLQDGKANKSNSTKAKAPIDEDPDQGEIKRLQGWLVKCGIRKLWGKELKPYETPKAKIKHLKEMLLEVGMTGRYSQDKANEIREARELAADIEAVQEGEQRWGTGDQEDSKEGDSERPQRRLVRGAKNYDFLSSDGEETD